MVGRAGDRYVALDVTKPDQAKFSATLDEHAARVAEAKAELAAQNEQETGGR